MHCSGLPRSLARSRVGAEFSETLTEAMAEIDSRCWWKADSCGKVARGLAKATGFESARGPINPSEVWPCAEMSEAGAFSGVSENSFSILL